MISISSYGETLRRLAACQTAISDIKWVLRLWNGIIDPLWIFEYGISVFFM